MRTPPTISEYLEIALAQISPGPFTISDLMGKIPPRRRPTYRQVGAFLRRTDGLTPPVSQSHKDRGIWQKGGAS
jgi:hypothetical protein